MNNIGFKRIQMFFYNFIGTPSKSGMQAQTKEGFRWQIDDLDIRVNVTDVFSPFRI